VGLSEISGRTVVLLIPPTACRQVSPNRNLYGRILNNGF
jgi:hypothetical protein